MERKPTAEDLTPDPRAEREPQVDPKPTGRPLILDGGLATELEARGHDLKDRLWSARLLRDAPQEIAAVHRAFLEAGADVISTASYQATKAGFIDAGLDSEQAISLIRHSVRLARQTRDDFWRSANSPKQHSRPRVAASIGPYGAFLANGAEYTGDYDLDEAGLLRFHRDRWWWLVEERPDLLLCETIPSMVEAQALATLAAETQTMPVWISFSCRDRDHLSDGTPVREVVRETGNAFAAIGVNCVPPENVLPLIEEIRSAFDGPIVVYPNSGEVYDAHLKSWMGSATIGTFVEQAVDWQRHGATIIGGCCRTTAVHIRALRDRMG